MRSKRPTRAITPETVSPTDLANLAVLNVHVHNVNAAIESLKTEHQQAVGVITGSVTDLGKIVTAHLLDDATKFGSIEKQIEQVKGQKWMIVLAAVGGTLSFLSGVLGLWLSWLKG